MKRFSLLAMFMVIPLVVVDAHATTIISDAFSASDNTTLTSHSLDVNLPVDQWRLHGNGVNIFGVPTIENGAASLSTDSGAMVYLSDYGCYSNPNQITISADLTINGITMAQDAYAYQRGVGLGFFSYSNIYADHGSSDFRGLVLQPNGTLSYLDNLAGRQEVAWSGIDSAAFSTNIPYTLSYSINTDTGRIIDINLSGSNADFSSIINDTANVFTVNATSGAGMMVSSSTVGTGLVDNFRVSTNKFDSFIGTPTGTVTNANYGQVGYSFYEVNDPVKINRLGYYDAGSNGLSAAHDVGLYKYVGGATPYELIAKATVPAATEATHDDGYRWVSIPETTLNPSPGSGDYYVLMASGDVADPRNEPAVGGLPQDAMFGTLTGNSFYVNEPFGDIGSTRSFTGDNIGIGTGGYSGANMGYKHSISNGRRIILEKGIQMAAYGFFREPDSPLNINRYLDADYTMIDGYVGPAVLDQLPDGTLFGIRPQLANPDAWDPEYSHQMTYINLLDEPGPHSHPGTLPVLLRLPEFREQFESFRTMFPDALNYISTGSLDEYTADLSGQGGDEAGLRAYMQGARPDMLMYSNYPVYSFPAAHREWWYRIMGAFRRVGLEGYDGTGNEPIPYGQFMFMARASYTDPDPVYSGMPCESYVRLQRFASLAFGFTCLEDWVYTRGGDIPVMFSTVGDSDPTEVYYYVAGGTFEGNTYSGVNREIKNLSPALSRLVSTDVRIICGTNTPQVPLDISTWSPGTADTGDYTDHITGVTPLGRPGITSDYSDVVIGYFEPLLDDNSDCTFVDGLVFMIVNGAAGNEVTLDTVNGGSNSAEVASGLASAWEEAYHITFDFTGSDFDSLVRLSRDTGEVELVTLTHTSGSEYYLDLLLPGGTGDLFAFWDSSDPLPTIASIPIPSAMTTAPVPEPSTLTLLAAGLIGLLFHVYRRKRHS